MRAVAVVLLLILTSCSAEESAPMADMAPVEAAAPQAARSSGSTEPAPAASRMVIRTASLTLVVSDAASTLQNIVSLVESRGGYLAQTRQWRENEQLRVEATLRVPEPSLSQVLSEIRKSAIRVESESMTGEDVSEEFSDLGAQLINLRAEDTLFNPDVGRAIVEFLNGGDVSGRAIALPRPEFLSIEAAKTFRP